MPRTLLLQLPDDCDCAIDVVRDCIRQAMTRYEAVQADDDCARCCQAIAKAALEAKEIEDGHSGPYATVGPLPAPQIWTTP